MKKLKKIVSESWKVFNMPVREDPKKYVGFVREESNGDTSSLSNIISKMLSYVDLDKEKIINMIVSSVMRNVILPIQNGQQLNIDDEVRKTLKQVLEKYVDVDKANYRVTISNATGSISNYIKKLNNTGEK